MSIFQAVILALIQGVTEFLPISSSAHLILLPYLFGWGEHSLTFDIITNAGTLTAVLVYFRKEIAETWTDRRRAFSLSRQRPGLWPLIAFATVPVALFGLTFYDWLASGARAPALIAATSIIFGLLLGLADRVGGRDRGLGELGWKAALVIGLAQAVALIPGTSRSGITLTAALLMGFRREDGARFSFLLAIPVGLMALAKDGLELWQTGLPSDEILVLAVAFVVSAISAFVVIDWLLAWLQRQGFGPFVLYRVLLGMFVLGLAI